MPLFKIIVVFEDQANHAIYEAFIDQLTPIAEVKFFCLSAHRHQEQLNDLMKNEDFDCVLAGADLSAHLPGIIAANTTKPVFGVPCPSAFDGLDAFSSILQMPRGIPVLLWPRKNSEALKDYLKNIYSRPARKIAIHNSDAKRLLSDHFELWEKAGKFLEESNQQVHFVSEYSEDYFIIKPVWDEEDIHDGHVYVPILNTAQNQSPYELLNWFNLAKLGGPWIGCNNLQNAYLACTQINESLTAKATYETGKHIENGITL